MDLESSEKFAIICQHKDTNPSNLNQVFQKYGCNSLEAKVPVAPKRVAENLQAANHDQKTLGTLALKSESASNYIDGRPARTRNREISLMGIGKDTLLVVGKERDRSPVERDDLDSELDQYMEITNKSRQERLKRIEARRLNLVREGMTQARLFDAPQGDTDENMQLSFDMLLQNMKS